MKNLPIYKIIENDLKEQIKNKKLKPGDLVPSENELKDSYNVSRMTTRQALNNLVVDGYLYRHKGKGTFVSQQKIEKNIHGVRSFTQEMAEKNRTVTNKVLGFSLMKATNGIQKKLFLDDGDEVLFIERIRYGDDIPILYEQLHVPQKLFKNLIEEDFHQSFYEYVEKKQGLEISHCIQSIEAINVDNKIRNILNIPSNDPVLLIVRNSFLKDGRPFEYVKSFYRADQYRLVQYAIKG